MTHTHTAAALPDAQGGADEYFQCPRLVMLHNLKIRGNLGARAGIPRLFFLPPAHSYLRGCERGVEQQRCADPVELRQRQFTVLDRL